MFFKKNILFSNQILKIWFCINRLSNIILSLENIFLFVIPKHTITFSIDMNGFGYTSAGSDP